jgi:hypothetical protein
VLYSHRAVAGSPSLVAIIGSPEGFPRKKLTALLPVLSSAPRPVTTKPANPRANQVRALPQDCQIRGREF